MPNTANINKLIARLHLDDGRHFKMADYMRIGDGEYGTDEVDLPLSIIDTPQTMHTCNTAFCVAGWANALRLREKGVNDTLSDVDYQVDDGVVAAHWLGITEDQADDLFYFDNIADMGMSEFDQLDPDVRKRAAIKVLEHLRDHDEVDWSMAIDHAQKPVLPESLTSLLTVAPPSYEDTHGRS